MQDDRHQQLLNILESEGYASVEELSQKLYVSMPTVRRDLAKLQEMGLVIRSHGGVMLRAKSDAPPLPFRAGIHAGEKLRLAHAAGRLLHDDCVVFIDESSTTLRIVDCLPKFRNITVVTNSMSVLFQLNKYKIPAYCTGGRLRDETMSFYGYDAEENISHFSIDLMFFSSSGLNSRGWIVDFSEEANAFRRHVLKRAERSVFLCDKSKYGRGGAHALMPMSQADVLVLNGPPPQNVDTGDAEVIII